MKRFLLIFFLLVSAAPLYAQNRIDTAPHVYILVVDDFGDHFGALSRQLRNNATVITRLRSAIQQLPPPSSSISFANGRATPTPAASTRALQQDLRAQARQAVMSQVRGNIDQQDCSVVPEGQGFFATSGTGFFATSGTGFFATSGTNAQGAAQPHGIRVAAEIQELIRNYGRGLPIDMVQVDTDGYTTSLIADRVNQIITQLSATHPNASFVINMSFAVVPCGALADLAVYDALMHQADADLAGDLDAMQAIFQQMVASGIYNATPNTTDALATFLDNRCRSAGQTCISGTNRVIMVAAAGNSSAAFPFYPAAWSGVISVSASDDSADFIAASGARASYSNEGAILMPGRWGRELGTSFAAPRYSFAMALTLLNRAPQGCRAPVSPALPDDWQHNPPAPPDQKLC